MFCVNQKTARGNGCLIKAHYTVNKLSEPQVQHIEFFIFVRIKKKGGGGGVVLVFLQPVMLGHHPSVQHSHRAGQCVATETLSKGNVLRAIQAFNSTKLMRVRLRADSNRIK